MLKGMFLENNEIGEVQKSLKELGQIIESTISTLDDEKNPIILQLLREARGKVAHIRIFLGV